MIATFLGSDTGNTINPIAKDYTHEQWKQMGYGVHLTINDGLFDSNHAFVGGALYISSDDTIIKKQPYVIMKLLDMVVELI